MESVLGIAAGVDNMCFVKFIGFSTPQKLPYELVRKYALQVTFILKIRHHVGECKRKSKKYDFKVFKYFSIFCVRTTLCIMNGLAVRLIHRREALTGIKNCAIHLAGWLQKHWLPLNSGRRRHEIMLNYGSELKQNIFCLLS